MSWIDGVFARGATPVLEAAIAFRERRHALLAQNIANASTPGYRPTDLEEGQFQGLLRKALAARASTGRFGMPAAPQPAFVREGQVRHDGNPFNVEREMAKLADNMIAHEHAVLMLQGKFRLLEMAIRGRAG